MSTRRDFLKAGGAVAVAVVPVISACHFAPVILADPQAREGVKEGWNALKNKFSGNEAKNSDFNAFNNNTPLEEKTAVQKSLNNQNCTSNDGNALVVDGDIGTKTAQAYAKLVKANPGYKLDLSSVSISKAPNNCKAEAAPTTKKFEVPKGVVDTAKKAVGSILPQDVQQFIPK